MADSPCILIVDDAPVLRNLIRMLLERQGFKTLQAGDANAALDAAREKFPDLVLMDIEMPGISGIEAIRFFRLDSQLARIPIIAVSGNSDRPSIEAARTAGAEGYLVKDEKLRERLIETIQRYLRSHAMTMAMAMVQG